MNKQFSIALLSMIESGISIAGDTQYPLRVEGLACLFCAHNVEKTVGKLVGVNAVKGNFRKGFVSVLVADSKSPPEEIVLQTCTDAAFALNSMASPAMVR